MDLVTFLQARLDEDEAAARRAKPGPWTNDGGVYAAHPMDEVVEYVYDDSADHIARHDPVRVLSDVEAKRRIVDLSEATWRTHGGCDRCVTCLTVRLLALPYADHEDYQPEGVAVEDHVRRTRPEL